jgi:plasmid maintenance system antidote protein VapI
MTLKQYIEERKLTHEFIALKWGISRAMISRLVAGNRKPSFAMKHLIKIKTANAVTVDDWN